MRHEPHRPAIFVHPLAGHWPIDSAGRPAESAETPQTLPGDFPVFPQPDAAMEPVQAADFPSPVISQPVSNAAMEQATDNPPLFSQPVLDAAVPNLPSPVISQPVSDAAMEQATDNPPLFSQPVLDAAVPNLPSPVISQPVLDAAVPNLPSPVISQPVSDAAMEQATDNPPLFSQPVSDAAVPKFPKIQFLQNRHNGRITAARRGTNAGGLRGVTEKTRLVEQLDLTTRRIIEHKDHKISELEAQV
jgi:hypothetical protein